MKPFKNPLNKSILGGLTALAVLGTSLSGCIIAEPRGHFRHDQFADNGPAWQAPQGQGQGQSWQGNSGWQNGQSNGHGHGQYH